MMTPKIRDIPRHRLERARMKLGWLRRFWRAEEYAGYCGDRWKLAEQLIEDIKSEHPTASISVSSMQRWEHDFLERGFNGLIDYRGRPGKGSKQRCTVSQNR